MGALVVGWFLIVAILDPVNTRLRPQAGIILNEISTPFACSPGTLGRLCIIT
jgi:hypothetical protein